MSSRASLVLSAAVLALCCSSCGAYGADFREVEVTGYTGAEVWKQVSDFADSRGFRADPNVTDIGQRIYMSRWSGDSVAFRRGSRQRFYAQILILEKTPPKWLIQYYVEIENVDDTSKNMRPDEADWEYVGQNRTREAEFLQVMRVRFPPPRIEGAGSAATSRTESRNPE